MFFKVNLGTALINGDYYLHGSELSLDEQKNIALDRINRLGVGGVLQLALRSQQHCLSACLAVSDIVGLDHIHEMQRWVSAYKQMISNMAALNLKDFDLMLALGEEEYRKYGEPLDKEAWG